MKKNIQKSLYIIIVCIIVLFIVKLWFYPTPKPNKITPQPITTPQALQSPTKNNQTTMPQQPLPKSTEQDNTSEATNETVTRIIVQGNHDEKIKQLLKDKAIIDEKVKPISSSDTQKTK